MFTSHISVSLFHNNTLFELTQTINKIFVFIYTYVFIYKLFLMKMVSNSKILNSIWNYEQILVPEYNFIHFKGCTKGENN